MLIIDGHEDLAWNAVVLGRDETLPLAQLRAREGPVPAQGEGVATVSLPTLREADVRVVFATIYATPYGEHSPLRRQGYRTPEEAFAQAQAQLAYYHRLEADGQVRLIRTAGDLRAVLAGAAARPGLVLLMEGADPIREPDDLGWFVEQGVRIVGLAWTKTRYAGGTGAPGPLTELGWALLRRMEALGVALDISHLADEACAQAFASFGGRIIASHANCRAIVPTERQLSDAQLRAVAERGGVIGLVLYNRFIRPNWRDGDPKEAVRLRDLLPHVDHIAELVGTAHLGLGSDLDGGVGREVVPAEIDHVGDLARLGALLAQAGYDDRAVAGIMGEHWRRWLEETLPE